MNTKSTSRNNLIIKTCLTAFFIFAVLFPLLKMLVNLADTDVIGFVSSAPFKRAAVNSLTTALTATAISAALACILAFFIIRSGIKGKSAWLLIFTLPMLIPSISHGIGLKALLGRSGILTVFLGLPSGITGFWGIVAGSVMYTFPIAFLMLADILKYQDGTQYEAAAVLGISRPRQFCAITLPYLRRPLISVVFSVFTMCITDYGVPISLGDESAKTLSYIMYQETVKSMDFARGSVISLALLLPAIAAFIIDLASREQANSGYVTRPVEIRRSPVRDLAAWVLSTVTAVLILLPVLSFIMLTFLQRFQYPPEFKFSVEHIQRAFSLNMGGMLTNSLIISLLTVVAGVAAAVLTAYFTARAAGFSKPDRGMSKFLHLISITSLAIPGLVLGLSYALFFNNSFIYSTLIILVMVNVIHFFASPYLMIYNTFGKLNRNLEDVGATLGLGRLRVFFGVILPQVKTTLAEMAAYYFINSMMTISAVSFLYTSKTQPLSLLIPEMDAAAGSVGSLAFISLVILAVNLAVRLIINTVKKLMLKGA